MTWLLTLDSFSFPAYVNVLIVGAGGLGLWVLKLAQWMIGESNSNIRLFVADNSIDKLITAEDEGCCDIIHWCEEDHEQYITEKTLESCRGGVDVVVDFVSSPRTMMRSLKVLNRVSWIFTQITAKESGINHLSVFGWYKSSLNKMVDSSFRRYL